MPRTGSSVRAALGLLVALAALGTSCTNAELKEDGAADEQPTTTAATAFVEGDATAGVGPIASGASPLKGMRGATPGIKITEDFRRKVLAVDPEVVDLAAAAEGYDVVVVIALSTESARSDAPGRIAEGVIESTTGGRTCTSFRTCRAPALTNTDYDYDGLSGNIELLANGDPGEAGFAVVEYTGGGALRSTDQVTVQSKPLDGEPIAADPIYGPAGDGVLTVGTLLPVTGPNGTAARGALAGAQLAVNEINDGGGVLGEPMVLVPDESGDGSPAATTAAVQALLGKGVDAVIGGTTYAISSVALGPLTDAGIVMFSPTDTSRALSVASDRGLFFRVSPSTDLEGQVLGNLVTNDGYTRIAIAAGSGDDDRELAADVAAAINAAAGTITVTVTIEPEGDGGLAAQQIIDSDPQAVVIVTPADDASAIIRALVLKGKGPEVLATYGTAANMTPELARLVGG